MVKIMVRDAYDSSRLCVCDFPSQIVTVQQLKVQIALQHPQQPDAASQRLLLAGRILKDTETISDDSLVVLSIKQSVNQTINQQLNFQPPWINLPSSVSSSPIQTMHSLPTTSSPSHHAYPAYQTINPTFQAFPVVYAAPQPTNQQPNQPINQAANQPVQPEPVAPPVQAGLWRYIDVRLMVKLGVLFLVFGRTENTSRQFGLLIAAIVAYLWQVGAFTRQNEQNAAGDEAAEAVARVRQARRQARGENRAGIAGLLANLGDENEEEDDFDDIVAQREQLAQMNAQHRAELIRRNQYQPESGPVSISRTEAAEKFIVGLFASLHPSWRIRELDE